MNKIIKAAQDLILVIDAHDVQSEDCDRSGRTFCNCLPKAVDKLRDLVVAINGNDLLIDENWLREIGYVWSDFKDRWENISCSIELYQRSGGEWQICVSDALDNGVQLVEFRYRHQLLTLLAALGETPCKET